uniref:RNA polymerase sigma-70 domain-containing protein n=1 Tax=Heterosigma akashiwo TaxID=2829 RepID=A0A7S4DAQ6_HETAK|mmetsp:Transcript_9753/g.16834  ORF Transcript_9753/g.16834 Transcript_9753/m.16834 type:complete len:416 (-) Transcript_9753:363-1610(-)
MKAHSFLFLWTARLVATTAFFLAVPGKHSCPCPYLPLLASGGRPPSASSHIVSSMNGVSFETSKPKHLPPRRYPPNENTFTTFWGASYEDQRYIQSTTSEEFSSYTKFKILTPKDEALLARHIKKGMEIQNCLISLTEKLGRTPTERELVRRVGSNSIEDIKRQLSRATQCRSALINANLRHVLFISRSYQHLTGIRFQDLVQEGTCSLHRAVDLFDPSKGSFSRYASWWVRHGILRAISHQSRTVRLPDHIHNSLCQISRAEKQYYGRYSKQPGTAELAQLTGLAPEKLEAIRRLKSDTECQTLGEERWDDRPQPQEATEVADLKNGVGLLLATLPPREQDVLRQRFGLGGDGHRHSLREIGEELGVSHERVRQIEAKALWKLRRPSWSHQLADHVTEELFLEVDGLVQEPHIV